MSVIEGHSISSQKIPLKVSFIGRSNNELIPKTPTIDVSFWIVSHFLNPRPSQSIFTVFLFLPVCFYRQTVAYPCKEYSFSLIIDPRYVTLLKKKKNHILH